MFFLFFNASLWFLKVSKNTFAPLSLCLYMVFAPKYRGKILIGDVAMICEGIICKTCKELGIEIIEIAVNPDHVHIFFKQDFKKRIPSSKGVVRRAYVGAELFSWKRWEWLGCGQ